MRFLNSHLREKFHHHSHKERIFGPFLLFFLGITVIISFFSYFFFFLNSPNPFSSIILRPKLGLESVHAQQNLDQITKVIPRPIKEKEKCDLNKGKWVKEKRGKSMYSNSSCKTIPESKNCFGQGRKDRDFLNWKWKPEKCEMPKFDPKAFLEIVGGKKLAFIGDSVARNHMESLLCLLSQEEIPQDVYKDSEDRFRTWYFPKSDFTLMVLWSKFLVVGEERVVNGSGIGIFDLQLDKVEDSWSQHLPEIDYAVISDGHWFFRVMYLHEGNNVTGCVYCNDPHIEKRDVSFAFQMAFRAALKYINKCKNCGRLVTILRTFVPAHFENGVWNDGGYCNRTTPMSAKDIDLGSTEWKMRNIQVEEIKRTKEEGEERNGKRYGMVDVTMAMMMRPDGHPGLFWGNQWMKGYSDCVHWCMPGPIDVWNDFLMAVIREEAALVS